MSNTVPSPPRTFISYSWSTPEHEARVLDLATDLRESGVDVILDKWDLKEGEEATAFMEQMVVDPNVAKVIIISDRIYSEKSDQREGGAGTEAQIISAKVYQGENQGKFAALVFEKDENGKAYLPSYYTSRIFIDFTDPSRATDSFEQLIRWIYDKPLHKKPAIGKAPNYLNQGESTIVLATSAAHRRAMDALQNSRPHAFSATSDFLEILTNQLPAFRIDSETDPLSDDIIENYNSFLPYRNEVIELVRTAMRLNTDQRYPDALHSFLERFLEHFHATPEKGRYREFDFDNYRFFAHELFLYICTAAIQYGRADIFQTIVSRPYYDALRGENGGMAVSDYSVFRHFDRLLEHRNKEMEARRISLHADQLKERAASSGFRFDQIMQTDFILFLRSALQNKQQYASWYPTTLNLLGFRHQAFELFARAQSASEFAKLLSVLGLEDRTPLDELVAGYAAETQKAPSFNDGWDQLDVARLANYENLGTMR